MPYARCSVSLLWQKGNCQNNRCKYANIDRVTETKYSVVSCRHMYIKCFDLGKKELN